MQCLAIYFNFFFHRGKFKMSLVNKQVPTDFLLAQSKKQQPLPRVSDNGICKPLHNRSVCLMFD